MKIINGSCATCGFSTPRQVFVNEEIPNTLTLLCMRAGGGDLVHGGAKWRLDTTTKHAVDATEYAALCVHPNFACLEFATKDSVAVVRLGMSYQRP